MKRFNLASLPLAISGTLASSEVRDEINCNCCIDDVFANDSYLTCGVFIL